MGLNNHLWFRRTHGEPEIDVQFRFGLVRELDYRIGDKVEWDDAEKDTGGAHEIGGIARVPEEGYLYFKIAIFEAVITSCDRISEAEYDQLD